MGRTERAMIVGPSSLPSALLGLLSLGSLAAAHFNCSSAPTGEYCTNNMDGFYYCPVDKYQKCPKGTWCWQLRGNTGPTVDCVADSTYNCSGLSRGDYCSSKGGGYYICPGGQYQACPKGTDCQQHQSKAAGPYATCARIPGNFSCKGKADGMFCDATNAGFLYCPVDSYQACPLGTKCVQHARTDKNDAYATCDFSTEATTTPSPQHSRFTHARISGTTDSGEDAATSTVRGTGRFVTYVGGSTVMAQAGGNFVTYVDVKGIDWSAQPPHPIVNAMPTEYTTVHASFYLPSMSKLFDFAQVIGNPNNSIGQLFIKQMHAANKRVVLTVGGATELPKSPSYFTQNEPKALASTLAGIVKSTHMDGVDIDYEDDYSNGNPGLTGYGSVSTRSVGGGPAVEWLCTLSKSLRDALPQSDGYTISHAPQAPYFDLGYKQVEDKCGDSIDYYNVQFYNQGPNTYTTAETLIHKESIHMGSTSVVPVVDGSLTDIINKQGVPAKKILIGKPVGTADASNGYVDVGTLASLASQAKKAFPDLGGMMGWQWGSDVSGKWISHLTTPWK